jgi:hypothetical protein
VGGSVLLGRQKEILNMKKVMAFMLGLSLFLGATTAFADGSDTTRTTTKVKKTKKTGGK